MSKLKDFSCAFHGNENMANQKLIYPAATRNQEPILQVLKRFVTYDCAEDDSPLFLEVASGSGQHLAHFAPHFPNIKFQPTEFDETLLGSIKYYATQCPTKNILLPIQLDICTDLVHYGFSEESIDYVYNANMIHISPYECTIGLFKNAGCYLKPNALMILYGPFSKDGVITPDSNVQFNASLKARNPAWGLRDISELIKIAADYSLTLIDTVEMPANNKTLIWKKN